MRRRAKVDRNQAELVAELRARGWLWLDLSAVGGGCPDGIAVKGGRIVFCEIKDGNKPPSARKLTPAQVELHAVLKAKAVTVEILTCADDLSVLGRELRPRREEERE